MLTGPRPYLPEAPRRAVDAPAPYAPYDPERMAALRGLYGGPPALAAPGPEELPPAPPPAPDANPYTPAAPAMVAPPQPAPPQPAPPPHSTWHDVQGFLAGFAGPEYSRQFQERDARASANAAAAATKDPNSPQSQQARAAAAPFLKRLGFEDADIARLSLADINSGGGLAGMMHQAAALRAEEAKTREGEERFKREQTFVGNTPEGKLQRAEAIGGMQSANQQAAQEHGAALSLTNAQQLAADAERRRIDDEARRDALKATDEERKRRLSGKPDPEKYSLPGVEVINKDRFRQIASDDVQRRKLEDAVGTYRAMQNGLNTMAHIREKNGPTALDRHVIGNYNAARTMVVSSLSTLAQTGVLNESEYKRYTSMLPDITPQGSDILTPVMGDQTLESIKGTRDALLSGIDAKLEIQGGVRLRPASSGPPNLGVTRGAGPKVTGKLPAGTKIRNTATGATGTLDEPIDASELADHGLEVL